MSRQRVAPTYEEIANAMQTVLDAACIELDIRQDGHTITLARLARCLDKAGLIDWSGVR